MKLHSEIILSEVVSTQAALNVAKTAAAGFKDAQDRVKKASKEAEDKHKAAEKAAKDAVNAEKKIAKQAQAAAQKAQRAAEAEHKAKTAQAVADIQTEIQGFVNAFFDNFPYKEGFGTQEEMREKYPTKEAAKAAFDAYDQFAIRASQLLDGINKSAVGAGYINKAQGDRFTSYARRVMDRVRDPGETGTLKNLKKNPTTGEIDIDETLINFVRQEANSFKRMIRIKDDFRMDDDLFKDILTKKLSKTPPDRKKDAVAAINHILVYIIAQLRGRARMIAAVGYSHDDAASAKSKATEDGAEAEAAAQRAAQAKANT